MTGIYAALRSGFWQNQFVFKNKNPLELLSFAFLNTLSISALDEKVIDNFIVITIENSFEEEEIKAALIKQLDTEPDKIKVVFRPEHTGNDLRHLLKTLSSNSKTVLIGSISINNTILEETSLGKTVSREAIDSHFSNGEEYIQSQNYQKEIFPIQIGEGMNQQEFLFDEWNSESNLNVNKVNGVATILLKADKDLLNYHKLPIVKVDQWKFSQEDSLQLVKLLKEFSVDESWIVEFDYLSLESFLKLKRLLKENDIKIPQMKSGGSVFYGNSKILNGFRAITSAMAQLEQSIHGKAILFIINENNTIEVLTLYRNQEVD
ncbi:hypothetical protein [Oceanobacillus damuensis]|uniref:hypothetical protein n=1 Tax=Oceanobacillus damuensis TaxID=937928 RepID=UPI00082CAED6|nr:hypothetical protein [Oceanobacillus damuensis]